VGQEVREVREIDEQVAEDRPAALLWDKLWPQGARRQCLIPEAADPALSP